MHTETPVIRLADYQPSDFLIDTVDLDVRLHPQATRVRAVLALRPNPRGRAEAPLVLDGDELQLRALLLDGAPLDPAAFTATPQALVLHRPPAVAFQLTIETELDPSANTKLMGLYRSSGIYCTQCEADGFRRITYFLDRPDVLAVYRTRIEADREEAPILLGNGNPLESGELADGRHFAVWHDPFPKPAYLFALVGGRLAKQSKTFLTMSGRPVEIAVHVEPGKESRAGYALDALERSMRWDERVFGREYDLDIFNVVAVSDFNMGAMENKGLNIFNDKYVLASPETAIDSDYAGIEAVIAHEYFHNWTGNRVTCRDWFQLCLKEGLTVFRDQEFSSDERSRAVHRIAEVRSLRARQFSEDAGPLAHSVRPTRYREINNFYTATVYDKGAEVVRMLRILIGADAFRRGMDLYFERCDGTAATVEDFLQAFADVTGRDLTHFARWYAQAGTPRLSVETHYDAGAQTFRIDFAQATPATPGQAEKEPLVIPILLGFVTPAGEAAALENDRFGRDGLFVLDRAADHLTFADVPEAPVPSVLRDFSAPVRLSLDLDEAALLALLRRDSDPFNRWQSAQTVAMRRLVVAAASGAEHVAAQDLADALLAFLEVEAERDPAFAALVLSLPTEAEIAQEIAVDVDPDAVFRVRESMRAAIGAALRDRLVVWRDALAASGPYSPDSGSAGRRSLCNVALDLIAAGDRSLGETLARRQYDATTNMTDRLAALATLALIPGAGREEAFADFADLYADEPLVMDKWLSVQAGIPEPETLARVQGLMRHPCFSLANPNRVRSLIGSFALANPTQFHRRDGAGYAFLADTVLTVDGSNPQVAARLLTALGTWRTIEPRRGALAKAALHRIAGESGLSPDVSDIAQRTLAEMP